ncbi:Na(+)/citrate cotransporter-like [Argopecten irradians]|uniref:Na(+)/citrate cotransporter-like n=1 Tax=Argopecten irradians TaxID=31199 RepID=UPI003714D2DD
MYGNGESSFEKYLGLKETVCCYPRTPLVLLPIVFAAEGQKAKCGFVILLVSVFWITEALPIAVTALLPVVVFPLVGIANAKDISTAHVNDTSMLFVGGLILAYAIKRWNIHKLFALRVLLWFGAEPHWLMLGMMIPTCFLFMWMSDTATSVMMLPIPNAVLVQLKHAHKAEKDASCTDNADQDSYWKQDTQHVSMDAYSSEQKARTAENGSDEENQTHQDHLTLCKALCLSICYAANIGGIATLTGTGVNVILKGHHERSS